MDLGGQQARRLLLSYIDNHRGQLKSSESQKDVLGHLVKNHPITYRKRIKRIAGGYEETDVGMEKYFSIVRNMVALSKDFVLAQKPHAERQCELWLKGSDALNVQGKRRYGLLKEPSRSAVNHERGVLGSSSEDVQYISRPNVPQASPRSQDRVYPPRTDKTARESTDSGHGVFAETINSDSHSRPSLSSLNDDTIMTSNSTEHNPPNQTSRDKLEARPCDAKSRHASVQTQRRLAEANIPATPAALMDRRNTLPSSAPAMSASDLEEDVSLQPRRSVLPPSFSPLTSSNSPPKHMENELSPRQRAAKMIAALALRTDGQPSVSKKRKAKEHVHDPIPKRRQMKSTQVADQHSNALLPAIGSIKGIDPTVDAAIEYEVAREHLPSTGPDRQQSDVSGVSDAARQDRTDPNTFRTVRAVSDSEVRKHHDSVNSKIRRVALDYFLETGADADGCPEWCSTANEELTKLFEQLFGSPWQPHARRMVQLEHLKAVDLVEGCIGAAVKTMVYDKELPWASPAKFLDSNKDLIPHLIDVMDEVDEKETLKLHEILWLASRRMVDSPLFQNSTIRAEAERLVGNLEFTLTPQLFRLGVRKSRNDPAAHDFWDDCHRELVDIFRSALTLKGLLHAAPDDHELEWVARGTDVDVDTMTGASRGGEQAQVALCICPRVWIRRSSREAWRVAAAARIKATSK